MMMMMIMIMMMMMMMIPGVIEEISNAARLGAAGWFLSNPSAAAISFEFADF